MIKDRQSKFLQKLTDTGDEHSVLKFSLHLISTIKTPASNIIKECTDKDKWIQDDYNTLMEQIRNKTESSKRQIYLDINPTLVSPSVYKNNNIPEHKRKWFSRLRLSSHNLKVETGRWSRTPRNERLCSCLSSVQTEEHVLLFCEKTAQIRNQFNITFNNISELFQADDIESIVDFIYEALQKMDE